MFYFLRHGQTQWNLEKRCMGSQDIPLHDVGIEQAQHAAQYHCADLGIITICTSPLKRAHQTASIIQKKLGCDLVVIDDLKECCWGEREGICWANDLHTGDTRMDRWLKKLETYKNSECPDKFLERVQRGINTALAQEGPVLLVSHSGIFRAITRLYDMPSVEHTPHCFPIKIVKKTLAE